MRGMAATRPRRFTSRSGAACGCCDTTFVALASGALRLTGRLRVSRSKRASQKSLGCRYIAEKDLLDSDDGDLYRIKTQNEIPPMAGWACARDGQLPAPSLAPYYPQPVPMGLPVEPGQSGMAGPVVVAGVAVVAATHAPALEEPIVWGTPVV